MSQIPTVKPGDAAANNKETVQANFSASHDAGEMVSTSAAVESLAVEDPKFYQTVPDNEIGGFLERLVELYTWTLTGADVQSILLTVDPWTDFLAKSSVADKTFNYSLIRGSLELVFVVMTQPSSYGSYAISAMPNIEANTVQDVNKDLTVYNCLQTDHYVRIDCASAENGVMQLPWVYYYDFADLPTGPAGMWAVSLACLQPIRSGLTGAAAGGQVRVFARLMPGYVLTVPRFQGPGRKGHLQPTSSTATHVPKVHAQLKAHASKSGKISSTADTIASVADKLSAIPVIGSAASTVATVAHAAGKLAHAFGFSRDTSEVAPTPMTMRSVTNVAHYEGNDSSDVAAFSQVCEISTDPTMVGSTPEDIMSFGSLFARWTLVKQFNWAQGTASGTDLGRVPVTPSYANDDSGYIYNTTAGYVGLPFRYWRGDMEYLVIIPASKFHRGSLQVYWCPVGSAPTADVTNTTLNTVIDLGSGEEHQFSVGYARARPYADNELLIGSSIINDNYTNGSIWFRVINPLTASNAAADTTIMVFARAGANMDFAVPRVSCNIPTGSIVSWNFAYALAQGGALGDEDTHDVQVHELVASSGPYPSSELLYGEQITSTRALMQKPSRVFYNYDATTHAIKTFTGKGSFPLLGTLPSGDAIGNTTDQWMRNFTWTGWLRPLFAGIATSERFKFFPQVPMIIGAARTVADVLETSAFPNPSTSTLAPVTYTGPNYGAEIQVPFYDRQKFRIARRRYDAYTNTLTATQLLFGKMLTTDPTVQVAIYHSYGPDIRVVGFRQVPRLLTYLNAAFDPDSFYQPASSV